jgi:hypothetical protein
MCAVNAVQRIRNAPTVLDGELEDTACDPQDLVYRGRRVLCSAKNSGDGQDHSL